jgi:hypothetical protein
MLLSSGILRKEEFEARIKNELDREYTLKEYKMMLNYINKTHRMKGRKTSVSS